MNSFNDLALGYQKGCIFCQVEFNTVLFSTQNFIVALDNFPLAEGHILLFSKNHYGCGGEIPEVYFTEMLAIKQKVSLLLNKAYNSALFYEHGRAGHCVSFSPDERLCHHFHLHALPLTCDISADLDKRFQQVSIASYSLINNLFKRFGEYLYFESNKRISYFYPVATSLEPHLLRTLIAQALQVPERADWEKYNDTALINAMHTNAYRSLVG